MSYATKYSLLSRRVKAATDDYPDVDDVDGDHHLAGVLNYLGRITDGRLTGPPLELVCSFCKSSATRAARAGGFSPGKVRAEVCCSFCRRW